MPSIFKLIIDNKIPSYKLYEDDLCIAILDTFPFSPGHTLIIPKVPTDYWMDVDDDTYFHIHKIAKKLAKAISTATGNSRIGQVIDGRQISHFHLHLIPLVEGQQIIHNDKPQLTVEEFKNMQSMIIQNLKG
jgi:histidine triad (HIT) family protein